MAEVTDVVEVLEEVLPIAYSTVRTRWAVGATALGALLGGVAGYFLAERRLRDEYNTAAEDAIDEMREVFRKRLIANETKPDLTELAAKIAENKYAPDETVVAEAVLTHPAVQAGLTGVPPKVPRSNVFQDSQVHDEWDWDVEREAREDKIKYIIHKDEVGDRNFDSVTMTYYEGDDVLCNEADDIVEQEQIVGTDNINFGHGSLDSNIVYVRNEDLEVDIEIIRSAGTYAEEVHGFSPPVTRPRRSREQDE